MGKWILVSSIFAVSVAQAQYAEQTGGLRYSGDYSTSTLRQLQSREEPSISRREGIDRNFDFVYVDLTGGVHQSINEGHLPTKVMPPKPSSPPPPGKPVSTQPPPAPPLPTPPSPPKGSQPPPVQPPPVVSLPPVVLSPPPAAAPEIDVRFGVQGLAFLVGGLLVVRGGRSRRLDG